MAKVFQKLAVVTAYAVLWFATVETNPTQAASVTNQFSVDINQGSLSGQNFSGSFNYDDMLLTGNGLEVISPIQGLTVNFRFLEQTFTESDDFFFNGFPVAQFNNGRVVGLNYFVANDALDFRFSNQFSGEGGTFFAYNIGSAGNLTDSGTGTVTYSIPEPSTAYGLGILGLGLLLGKKKAFSQIS